MSDTAVLIVLFCAQAALCFYAGWKLSHTANKLRQRDLQSPTPTNPVRYKHRVLNELELARIEQSAIQRGARQRAEREDPEEGFYRAFDRTC